MELIIRGTIFTGKANSPLQEAILVRDNTIVFVGSFSEAKRRTTNAKVMDFGQKLVTPGLIDAHCHMSLAGLYMEIGIDASHVGSIGELLDLIRSKLSSREWIYVYGLSESKLRERRLPTRWDLDEVAPSKPVVVEHASGHLVIANTEALRRAGITRHTRSPPGGLIDRDEQGEPTGILYDAAMSLVLEKMPPPHHNDWVRGLSKAQRIWVQRGFTAVEDTGTFQAFESILNAYKELESRGELVIRARVAYAISSVKELGEAIESITRYRGMDTEWLRTNLVKFFYDGSGLARTALLYDDWCKDNKPEKGNKGLRVMEPEDAYKIITTSIGNDIRVAVHAIGDRAVDEILDVAKKANEARLKDCALSIVHAILVTRNAVKQMRSLSVCVKTQTGFIYSHGDTYASNLCTTRARMAFPLRTLINNGVVVANSTDAPFVGSPNPVEGLYGAVYRKTRTGREDFGREEAVSFREALETYTYMAAKATGWDDVIGEIVAGKRADIVVWNISSLEPSEQELLDMKPLLVMVNGRIVHKEASILLETG